ncbi:hypothetical protein EYZ11_002957 [Aspergillus tanneri]|uniref:Uncharacterized protein n=1 Tax=Aspergillus tanneri TaxID=1220188 RepID=A0A4V3UQ39_9EURO|nr:hypothetical protein EYZ11_002957 [Aspergillus tanneri]
MEVVDSTKTQG